MSKTKQISTIPNKIVANRAELLTQTGVRKGDTAFQTDISLTYVWDDVQGTDNGGTIINVGTGSWVASYSGMKTPEMFGGLRELLSTHISKLTNKEFYLAQKTYDITGLYYFNGINSVMNEYEGLKLFGSGTAKYSNDNSHFIEGTGTIIKGSLMNHASGFHATNLSVDVGNDVVAAYGSHMEGFVPSSHKLDVVYSDYSTYFSDIYFDNISVLMADPTVDSSTFKHGILFERAIRSKHGSCETRGGYHGYVNKSIECSCGNVIVSNTTSTNFILKSDAYTQCKRNTINSISSYNTTGAGILESGDGVLLEKININSIISINTGVCVRGLGVGIKTDISIGSLHCDVITGDGIYIDNLFSRVAIGTHIISNCSQDGIKTIDGANQISIGSGTVTNCVNGYTIGNGTSFSFIEPNNCSGYGVNPTITTNININNVKAYANALGKTSKLYELLNSSDLVNGWVNSAIYPFQVLLIGDTVHVKGTIRSGTASTIATLPSAIRPSLTLAFIVSAVSNGTRTFGHVDVQSDGVINLANFSTLVATIDVSFNFSYTL